MRSSLLNKLFSRDLVHGIPKVKFVEDKVCDTYAREKQTRSLFKKKKHVSTSRPLELLHMDLYGPIKVQSRGEKRYIIVIADDF